MTDIKVSEPRNAVMTCSTCKGPARLARWRIYSVHPVDSPEVHPRFARYPASMWRACDEHLTDLLRADRMGSEGGWLVEEMAGDEARTRLAAGGDPT